MTFLANKQKGRPKRPPFLFALLLSLFLIQPASNHTADDTTEDGRQVSQSEASASGRKHSFDVTQVITSRN